MPPSRELLKLKARLASTVADQLALAVTNVRLRQRLREQSIRDALTGLYNRRFMDEAIERELARSTRYKTPMRVVMVDLDRFKRFNDDYGHTTADVLLPETNAQIAVEVVARIHERLSTLLVDADNGETCRLVTASMGVASFPQHGQQPLALIRAADEALYSAKEGGRNQTVIAAQPASHQFKAI